MLGHEGCGQVVRSARPGISAGERLTFSVTDVCGKCEFSRSEESHLIHKQVMFGLRKKVKEL